MKLKLSIKMPPIDVSGKVTRSFKRALAVARSRIVPLVTERAQELVKKAAPAMVDRYKKALTAPRAIDVTPEGVVLTVTDPLVLAVDRGTKAFDLKQKLLAHAKKSSPKSGPYVDVPFTHKAGSVPTKIRTAASKVAKITGSETVRMSMTTPGKSFTRQLQRGRIMQALGVKAKKQQVQHKRGIHDDIVRRSSGSGSRASFTTIRRISAASANTSWWNPGFKAAHVLEKILPGVKREVAGIIRDAFSTVRSEG